MATSPCLKNVYVDALIPNVIIFGGGDPCEGIRFRVGHESNALVVGLVAL